jgi:hypothetical protein
MEQTHIYVVLDYDDERTLVVKKTEYSAVLEAFSQKGIYPMWDMPFTFGDRKGTVTIYGATFTTKPTGENLEEVERLVMKLIVEEVGE